MNKGTTIVVTSDTEDILSLHSIFDPNHNNWMSCHAIRQWVKQQHLRGKCDHSLSDFGFGYQSTRDFDRLPDWKCPMCYSGRGYI